MNLIDNGVKEIIKSEKVISETKCYFLVTFKDYYGRVRQKETSDLEKFARSSWVE